MSGCTQAVRAELIQERCQRVIRLRNGQSADIANAIATFIQDVNGCAKTTRDLPWDVTIVAEPTTNSLLINAASRDLDRVLRMIEQLDRDSQGSSERVRPAGNLNTMPCLPASECPRSVVPQAPDTIEVVPVPTGTRPR